jgi:uncharacterized protein (UPF0147 family)
MTPEELEALRGIVDDPNTPPEVRTLTALILVALDEARSDKP